MKTIDVHDVQTHISSMLTEIEREHETFLICRHGNPVADLIPHHGQTPGIEKDTEPTSTENDRLLQKFLILPFCIETP